MRRPGTDVEWEERQKTRQLEMEACSKALSVLSSMMPRIFAPRPSILPSCRPSAALLAVLVLLTCFPVSPRRWTASVWQQLPCESRVELDAFSNVRKAIDDMVAALLQEKADEIKHKDFCVEEFNTNQLQTEEKERKKSDLITKIEDLDMTIKTVAADIERLKSEIF